MLTQADKNEILKDFAEWSGGYHPSETDDVETYIELALDNKFQDRADEVAEWMMSDEESKRYEKEEESKTRTKYDEKLKGDPNRTGSRLKVKAGSKVAIKELGSYYWVDDGVLWCAPMNADGTMDTFDGMHCPVETVNAKDLKIINDALGTHFHLEDFSKVRGASDEVVRLLQRHGRSSWMGHRLVKIFAEFDDFQPATRRWLKAFINATKQWDNYEKWKSPPIEALQDFKGLGLDEATTLYRGVFWPEAPDLLRALKLKSLPKRGDEFPYNDEHISSWSKRLRSAINFTNGEKYFVVLTYTADPEESFLDLTKVYDSDTAGYIKSEEEVLLKPGRYKVRVERISDAMIDDLRQANEAHMNTTAETNEKLLVDLSEVYNEEYSDTAHYYGTMSFSLGGNKGSLDVDGMTDRGGNHFDELHEFACKHWKLSEDEEDELLEVLTEELDCGDKAEVLWNGKKFSVIMKKRSPENTVHEDEDEDEDEDE